MTSNALNKIKAQYKLSDDDLNTITAYLMTGNKTWAYLQGAGKDSAAKAGSLAVIASRYFNDTNISEAVSKGYVMFSDEFMKLTNSHVALTDDKKEKTNEQENNINSNEMLTDGMSRGEAINVLNKVLAKVRDPKQFADITLKITSLMKFETTGDTTLKPLIYLPQRCESCQYKPNE